MTLYLDSCCVSRPFDDQTLHRNHLEAEAILLILDHVELSGWIWLGSDVLDDELMRIASNEKRLKLRLLTRFVKRWVTLTDAIVERGEELQDMGFGGYDALHLASAEHGGADLFLSTDDRLVRRAERHRAELSVMVRNPLTWLQEIKSI